MTPHFLLILGISLLASIIFVLAHIILRQLRKRIDIRRYVKGFPAQNIAYLKHSEGKAAEVYLPDGTPKVVGRISIDKTGDKAVVQLLQSGLDEDNSNPIFKPYGYIGEDAYIYAQETKDGPVKKLGYVANPDDPAKPCHEGKRSWRQLWLHKYLDVYRFKEGFEEDLPVNPADPVDPDDPDEVITAALDAVEDAIAPILDPEEAKDSKDEKKDKEGKKEKKGKKKEKKVIEVPKNVEMIARCDMQGFGFPKAGVITAESRAGAYAMFAYLHPNNSYEEYYNDPKYGWNDTALLAALVYSVCYVLYYLVNTSILQRPLMGTMLVATPIVYGFYYVIWALIRSIKVERAESGNSFQPQLNLLNKAIGQRGIDVAILVLAAAAIPVSTLLFQYDFVPLLTAIMTGVGINMTVKGVSTPWKVKKSYTDRATDEPEEDESGVPVTNQPPVGDILCTYDWDLDYDGVTLHGNLGIRFDSALMKEERQNNPSFSQTSIKSRDIVRKLFDMLCKRNDYMERTRFLARYIENTATRADLAEHIKLQFALDFIQEPNIRFVLDGNSERIQKPPGEYMRLPDETLFDKEGDYDCKTFFAAMLFYSMGYDVLFLYSQKHHHYAIAVEERYRWTESIWTGTQNKHKIRMEAAPGCEKTFIVCETVADKFRVGDLLEGIELDDFELRECFHHEDAVPNIEDIEYRNYDWDYSTLHAWIPLEFNMEQVAALRKGNPFVAHAERADIQNAEEMLHFLGSKPRYTNNISEIASAIKGKCPDAGKDQIQFTLNFASAPNIRDRKNSESAQIGFRENYIRYPDELLVDKQADERSKIFFCSILLSLLDYDTVILKSEKGVVLGIALEEPVTATLDLADAATREVNGKKYLLCGMQKDGITAGQLRKGDTPESYELFLEIPRQNNE